MRTNRWSTCRGELLTLAWLILLGTGCEERESRKQPTREEDSHTQADARSSSPAPDSVEWSPVNRKMGRPGKQEAGGVYRYSMPRTI